MSSSSISAPFPPSTSLLATVRQSCNAVRTQSEIEISQSAISTFLHSLSQANFNRLKSQHGVAFPLQFDSLHTELNFLAVLALLNTLSAYRKAFHTATGQGAYQNVVKLCIGLYISSPDGAGTGKLSADGLASLTADEVAQLWGVSLFQEKRVQNSPIVMGQRGGEMNEIVELVVKCCNETGQRLQQGGYPDLGSFMLEALKEGERIAKTSKGDEIAPLNAVLDKIVRGVPGFADMYLIDGQQPVYLFKKAFFFLFAIHQRFSGKSDMWMPNPTCLPMFVDNVLPTMLKAFGIIDLSHSTSPALRKWAAAAPPAETDAKVIEGPILTHEDAYRVRAAALDAGTVVVEEAKKLAEAEPDKYGWMGGMAEADLDGYLWSVGKDDAALRKVPRLVEKQTIMY